MRSRALAIYPHLPRLTRRGQLHLALIALALLVRLPFLAYPGFYGDLQIYVSWGRLMHAHFWDFYSAGSGMHWPPSYPPLAEYLFAAQTGVAALVAHVLGLPPSALDASAPLVVVCMKLPALLADLATVSLIHVVARRRLPLRWAALAAASYALAPAVLLDGAIWGQTDALFTLCLLLALLAALHRRPAGAGLLTGLTVMLKPEPLIFLPLVLAYLWCSAGPRAALRAAASLSATCLLVCLPYLLPPHPQMLVYRGQTVPAVLANLPFTSVNAMNAWWLLGLARRSPDVPLLGPLSPVALGWLCYLVVLGVALHSLRRDSSPARLFLAAALLSLVFFVCGAEQHERYLFPALALLLFAAIHDRRYAWHALVVNLTSCYNLAFSALIHLPTPYPSPIAAEAHQFFADHWELTPVVALVNVWLLGDLAVRAVRASRRSSGPVTPPSPGGQPDAAPLALVSRR